MPNTFWPNTKQPPGYPLNEGTAIQQNTAANNPDIFCQSQGSGYRLPSIAEFNSSQRAVNPGGSYQGQLPAHWSHYQNNDISQTRLTVDAARGASGSLYNEWGDVSKYGSGWVAENYWATEMSVMKEGGGYARNVVGGWGRIFYVASTGASGYPPVGRNEFSSTTAREKNTTSNYNVACVRDLVPTPSTPNPSKT